MKKVLDTNTLKKTAVVAKDGERPLADVIREVSQSMKSLLASGLNRKAVVVLVKDDSGMTKGEISRVLDSLEVLEKRYCK